MRTEKLTLYRFKLLPEKEQFHRVFTEGTFIDSVEIGVRTYIIYAIENFYVEVIYDWMENKIIENKSFITGPLIDKYIM